MCHVLHERLGDPVTLEALGWAHAAPLQFVPADHGLDQVWDAPGVVDCLATVVDADVMERRQLLALTGLTLTGVAQQWLLDPGRVAASVLGKRVDHTIIDDLERVAGARRRMDDAIGQFGEAEPHLQRAVSMLDPAHSRDRAGWLCHLATARVQAGRVEHPCATASEAAALIRWLDSAHDKRRLGDFRQAAEPYAGSVAVREFDSKHRALIGPRLA